MQPDPEYLRQHYATLSDEALLDLDRADLVEMAQQLYDHEIARRGLADGIPDSPDPEEPDAPFEPIPVEDQPAWAEDAAAAISYNMYPGSTQPPPAADAFNALRAAGIPCFLDLVELPQESAPVEPTGLWRVMVPNKFSFRASSALSKAIFTAELETNWKAHLEALSDEEFAEMNPREDFSGLYDQIERVTKIYNEERSRRSGTN